MSSTTGGGNAPRALRRIATWLAIPLGALVCIAAQPDDSNTDAVLLAAIAYCAGALANPPSIALPKLTDRRLVLLFDLFVIFPAVVAWVTLGREGPDPEIRDHVFRALVYAPAAYWVRSRFIRWGDPVSIAGDSSLPRLHSMAEVRAAERQRLQERRASLHLPTAAGFAALALSGGGIRSALTCIGVLSELAEAGLLERFDYLSTVSGGGWCGGAWLTSGSGGASAAEAVERARKTFVERFAYLGSPFLTVAWHLARSAFLTVAPLALVFCAGILPTLAIMASEWFDGYRLHFVVDAIEATLPYGFPFNQAGFETLRNTGMFLPEILFVGTGVCLLFGAASGLAVVLLRVLGRARSSVAENLLRVAIKRLAAVTMVSFVLQMRAEALVFAGAYVASYPLLALVRWARRESANGLRADTVARIPVAVVVGWAAWALIERSPQASYRIEATFAWLGEVLFGVVLALFDAFLTGINQIEWDANGNGFGWAVVVFTAGLVVSAFAVSRWVNRSELSLAPWWRRRIAAAFLQTTTWPTPSVWEPLHVVNCAINSPEWRDKNLRAVRPFEISRLFSGGPDVGWIPTAAMLEKDGLAIALAASAAAVATQAGASTLFGAALLSPLNAQLGVWMRSPKWSAAVKRATPGSLRLLLRESLGTNAVDDDMLFVSDGGHFDNLGIAAMLERDVEVVLAVDAGHDAAYAFEDLGTFLGVASARGWRVLSRSDGGPWPGIGGLGPRGKVVQKPVVQIELERGDANDARRVRILLLKLSRTAEPVIPDETLGVMSTHFPQDPTSNQFYTEAQARAYIDVGRGLARNQLDEIRALLDTATPSAARDGAAGQETERDSEASSRTGA